MVVSLLTGTWPLGEIPGERQKRKSSSSRAVFTYKLHNSSLLALISRRLTMPNIMEMLCKYFLHCTPQELQGGNLCVFVRVLFLPSLRILDPLSIEPPDAESMDVRDQLQFILLQWWPSPDC